MKLGNHKTYAFLASDGSIYILIGDLKDTWGAIYQIKSFKKGGVHQDLRDAWSDPQKFSGECGYEILGATRFFHIVKEEKLKPVAYFDGAEFHYGHPLPEDLPDYLRDEVSVDSDSFAALIKEDEAEDDPPIEVPKRKPKKKGW